MTARPGAIRWPSIRPRPGTSSSPTSMPWPARWRGLAGQPHRRRLQRAAAARQHLRRRGPAGVVGHRRGQHLCGLLDERRRRTRHSPSRCRRRATSPHTRCSAAATSRSRATTTGSRSPNEPTASLFGYMSWTDNRDVVEGDDPRETTAEGGYDDNFDVLQCRIDLGAPSEDDVLEGRAACPSRRAVQRRQLRQRRRAGPEHLRDVDHVPVADNPVSARTRPSGGLASSASTATALRIAPDRAYPPQRSMLQTWRDMTSGHCSQIRCKRNDHAVA